MGMLAVCVLVCAVMVQIKAAATKGLEKNWGRCGKDWTWINNRCFRYMPAPKSWAQAERSCISMGATLASVHSIEEYHEIQSVTATYGYKQTWIGGSDAQEERVWLWTDASAFSYTNWCPGEPNDLGGSQHCLQMNFSHEKCWDDAVCSDLLPYICARKM
ncbi:Ladderlectin [Oryzias melastigma]|uniref:Ladderlectin n=1 Tax=Oryzias melastigma TaxID=30732 RepID=A0A834C6H5_ORYME|nr:Ladderlectin [Oryzias melastigma]